MLGDAKRLLQQYRPIAGMNLLVAAVARSVEKRNFSQYSSLLVAPPKINI
jgi:hypothetical protein